MTIVRSTIAGGVEQGWVELKRFFVSHSSADKALALELKSHLDDDAWVDLHEIDVGDLLLEQISSGIENATDFALLWSAASAQSRWVQFELHMAFIRWMEDSAIAIRVIRLDETPVPLYLRPFLQARGANDASTIAASLVRGAPAPRARRTFLNRNKEIEQIEEALYSERIRALFVCGLPGIGKRSLARESLLRLTVGTNASHTVALGPGTAESELNLLVASALGVPAAPEGAEFESVMSNTLERIRDFANSGGIWVFEGAEHLLTEEGHLGRILRPIIDDSLSRDGYSKLLLFTSRRRPRLDPAQRHVDSIFIDGLRPAHAVVLLRNLDAIGEEPTLAEVAKQLDGHPLALEVIAPRLPMSPTALIEQRHAIATDLVDPAAIAPNTWQLLEILALADGPLSGQNIADLLEIDPEELREAIAEASHYALVMYDPNGHLSLHPLVRDYFFRSFRARDDHQERTSRVANVMSSVVASLEPGDAQYAPTLLAAVKVLGLAGRFDEARELRRGLTGTLLQTATELYHEKRYAEALPFIDEAITGVEEVDKEALQLKVKTLAYLGQVDEARALGDRLVARYSQDAAVLRDRGRVAYIERDWDGAIEFYQRAIPHRHRPAQLWSDIAQARMRAGNWSGAAAAARTAIDQGGDTPWTLDLYAESLEKLGDLEEAELIITRAVEREPTNANYRHRLGRIAQRRGNHKLAIEQFTRSGALDPNHFQSRLSLASMHADAGSLDEAQRELDAATVSPGVPAGVSQNVQAKIRLLQGDVEAAHDAISVALKDRRDAANLALAVQVWIMRAEMGKVGKGQARAQVKVLSSELDDLGELQSVLELSRQFPEYFGA
ncbi:toll/interleukin-1 receptor domain-containing protein [Agromyces seonyuensis]|uniref:Tetratricopeptide repeat protein n=1 Tax=Agromyces seonyuensis TaxID=2662446 RepID=A0A6I4NXM5_9MICO|nr:toll/interleukin-1 receptor domain-containing protein [Agromyces seonyuensis]MWB97892.1 tetratricopeptide repeat protein [Agromyces seonyuensis]